jgi:hypothetical protein
MPSRSAKTEAGSAATSANRAALRRSQDEKSPSRPNGLRRPIAELTFQRDTLLRPIGGAIDIATIVRLDLPPSPLSLLEEIRAPLDEQVSRLRGHAWSPRTTRTSAFTGH